MSFRVSGLPVIPFRPLFALDDDALRAQGARRCRVSLRYTRPGETAILLPYTHQPAPHSPFQARGPIFVREAAGETFDRVGELPEVLAESSSLSVRAYDGEDMIVDADIVPGAGVAPVLERMLARADVGYIHVHFAPRGCYLARVTRA